MSKIPKLIFIIPYRNRPQHKFFFSNYLNTIMQHSYLKDDYEVGFILNSASPSSKSTILDIGCGTGHHVALLASKGLNVIGIDFLSAV